MLLIPPPRCVAPRPVSECAACAADLLLPCIGGACLAALEEGAEYVGLVNAQLSLLSEAGVDPGSLVQLSHNCGNLSNHAVHLRFLGELA